MMSSAKLLSSARMSTIPVSESMSDAAHLFESPFLPSGPLSPTASAEMLRCVSGVGRELHGALGLDAVIAAATELAIPRLADLAVLILHGSAPPRISVAHLAEALRAWRIGGAPPVATQLRGAPERTGRPGATVTQVLATLPFYEWRRAAPRPVGPLPMRDGRFTSNG